jgi:hypothetical protein
MNPQEIINIINEEYGNPGDVPGNLVSWASCEAFERRFNPRDVEALRAIVVLLRELWRRAVREIEEKNTKGNT